MHSKRLRTVPSGLVSVMVLKSKGREQRGHFGQGLNMQVGLWLFFEKHLPHSLDQWLRVILFKQPGEIGS
jgi:hypothetical protein